MIRKFVTLFTFLIIIFISFGYGWSFDKEHGNINIGNEPGFTYVNVTTIGTATGLVPIISKNPYDVNSNKWRKISGSFLLRGMGCVVSNKYVITAAHVVHPASVTLAEQQWNFYRVQPIEVISKLIFISADPTLAGLKNGGVPATIYHLDIDNDIAVLKFDAGNIFEPVRYNLYNTRYLERGRSGDMLRIGDAVAIVARSRDEDGTWTWGFEVRHGHVVSTTIKGVIEKEIPWFGINDFTMDLIIKSGDSGSAIFAFKNGEAVIIGIARATNQTSNPFERRAASLLENDKLRSTIGRSQGFHPCKLSSTLGRSRRELCLSSTKKFIGYQ